MSLSSRTLRRIGWTQLGPCCRTSLASTQRHFATETKAPVTTPKKHQDDRPALQYAPSSASVTGGKKPVVPPRVLIYHSGTPRVVVMGFIKLTAIFNATMHLGSMYPSWLGGGDILDLAGLAATGLAPLAFVTWTTAPIVTAIHLHVPAYTRADRNLVERYAASVPATEATIDMTTLSFIGKPRLSRMKLADLRPVPAGLGWRGTVLGLVNWDRDTAEEDRRRRWWHYRAVARFGVHWEKEREKGRSARYAGLWRVLKKKLGVEDVVPRGGKEAEKKKTRVGHYDAD